MRRSAAVWSMRLTIFRSAKRRDFAPPLWRGLMAGMSRFQFSLRTLLVAALALPPAGYWIFRSKQAANAAHDYVRAAAFYDVGTATFEQVYDCSRRLRDAELAMPFANRRAVLIGYLNRLAYLEERLWSRIMFSTSGGNEELEARLAAIRVERKALEAELGVTADPALGGAHQFGTLDTEIPDTDP